MQLYFLTFLSSSLLFLEVVVTVFDYFRKPNSLFSKFRVNCLLMYYFVYCNLCALKGAKGACYRTCSLVALRVPYMCFWPAKTGKNIDFFEMLTCLWPGAQIWFRHKWRKLVTDSLLLLCNNWYSCLRYLNEFFFSCVSGFRKKFSRIALWRKRLQLDSKSYLATNGFFWSFLVGLCPVSSTSCLHGLKSTWIAQLFFFLTISSFFDS